MQKILLLMSTMIVSHAFSAHAEDDSSIGSNSPLYASKIDHACPSGYMLDDFHTQPDKPCIAKDPFDNVVTLVLPKKESN